MSITVTVCVAVAVLPEPSVTVQITVLVPNGNVAGALFVTLATEQLSDVTALPNVANVAEQELFAFTVMLAGTTIVGAVLSFTVTVCVAVAVLPEPSVTVQITVVVPNGNGDGALFVTLATVQLSEVVGVPIFTLNATHEAFALTVTFDGAVIVGFALSFTVTVCVAVAVLPEPSVTVHVTVVTPNGNVAGALFVTVAPAQLSDIVGVPKVTLVA